MALCNPCYDLFCIIEQDNPSEEDDFRDQEVDPDDWFVGDDSPVNSYPSGTVFRDWLEARDANESLPNTLPQLSGLVHSSWTSFCDSLDSYCPVCWVVWRHIRDSPTSSYRGQTRQIFYLWLVHGSRLTSIWGELELECSASVKDSDKIVISFQRTTKQRFEGNFLQ